MKKWILVNTACMYALRWEWLGQWCRPADSRRWLQSWRGSSYNWHYLHNYWSTCNDDRSPLRIDRKTYNVLIYLSQNSSNNRSRATVLRSSFSTIQNYIKNWLLFTFVAIGDHGRIRRVDVAADNGEYSHHCQCEWKYNSKDNLSCVYLGDNDSIENGTHKGEDTVASNLRNPWFFGEGWYLFVCSTVLMH